MKKLLKRLLAVQSESGHCEHMQEFLKVHIARHGYASGTDEKGNIYVRKGSSETYPTYVAHMDTVHDIDKNGSILPIEVNFAVTGLNPRTMQQTGIGGDDKCGIYAALRCLRELDACKAVFFVDEEVGCKGSKNCDITFFKDSRFVLQADRRGNDDWVSDIQGPLGSDEFQAAVQPFLKAYGFKPRNGAFTDVMALRDGEVGVSVANMSAGYYNPHGDGEFIYIPDLDNTTEMMIAMGRELAQPFPFSYERPAYKAHGCFQSGVAGGGRSSDDGPTANDWYKYGYNTYRQKQQEQDTAFPEYQSFLDQDAPDIAFVPSSGDLMCASCRNVHAMANLRPLGKGYYICVDCAGSAGLSLLP